MKLKVPKTERRRPQDSRLRRILRRVLIIALVVGLMGLAATHLLALITGYDVLAVPEEGVSAVMTPLQSGPLRENVRVGRVDITAHGEHVAERSDLFGRLVREEHVVHRAVAPCIR